MHVLRIDNAVRIMYTLRSNNCVLGLKSQFAIITCSHLKPVLRYIISMSFSASNNFIIVVTAIVLRVCVCLFVVFFCRHVHLDPDVRFHRGTENSFT